MRVTREALTVSSVLIKEHVAVNRHVPLTIRSILSSLWYVVVRKRWAEAERTEFIPVAWRLFEQTLAEFPVDPFRLCRDVGPTVEAPKQVGVLADQRKLDSSFQFFRSFERRLRRRLATGR